MSDESIETLIEQLVAKAGAGDIEAATEVLELIANRFDELRTTERNAIRQSAAARRAQGVEQEAIEELTSHVQAGADMQMSRSAFLLESVSILHEIETEQTENATATQVTQQNASEELAALGDRVQTQQDEYEKTAKNAAETTDDTDVPAQVSVESINAPNTVYKREDFSVTATIKNVGDQPAEDVGVTVKLSEDGDNQQSATIGTLEGGEVTSEEWVEISGTETVIVSVESSNGGSDGSETAIIVEEPKSDEPTFPDYADEETGVVETEGLREAIDDWREDDIGTGLLREVIDAWRS